MKTRAKQYITPCMHRKGMEPEPVLVNMSVGEPVTGEAGVREDYGLTGWELPEQ